MRSLRRLASSACVILSELDLADLRRADNHSCVGPRQRMDSMCGPAWGLCSLLEGGDIALMYDGLCIVL